MLELCKYVLRSWGEGGHIIVEFSREPGKKQYTHQLIEAKKLPFQKQKIISCKRNSRV
jgi:hypothetical protein